MRQRFCFSRSKLSKRDRRVVGRRRFALRPQEDPRAEAERLKVPFLGEVPLHLHIREAGDSGAPVTGQRGRIKLTSVFHSPTGYASEAGFLDAAAGGSPLNIVVAKVDRQWSTELGHNLQQAATLGRAAGVCVRDRRGVDKPALVRSPPLF